MKRKMSLIAVLIGLSLLVQGQSFDLRTGQGAVGSVDPNWTLTLPGGGAGIPWISTGLVEFSWGGVSNPYAQSNCGQWLSPYISASNNVITTGGTSETFTYRREFTVTNLCLNPTANLNLNWIAGDNLVQDVRINGTSIPIPAGIDFNPAVSITGSPMVMVGVNNIEIDVFNNSSFSALQVCGSITVSNGLIDAPRELDCCKAAAGNILSWMPVPGASGYQIEITWNDPDCCKGGEDPTQIRFNTIDPIFFVSHDKPCFSWRVRAINCDSDWSYKMCGCGGDIFEGESASNVSNNGTLVSESLDIFAAPNPANESVTISMNDYSNSSEVSNAIVSITDIQGKEVFRSDILVNEAKKINVSEFNSGIYLYRIIDLNNKEIIKSDKLIIE